MESTDRYSVINSYIYMYTSSPLLKSKHLLNHTLWSYTGKASFVQLDDKL